ncbi:AbiJ-NTD4 domain-containing protein [Klebsiella pneumoniae]
MDYFSDKENGHTRRIVNEVSHTVWCGLASHITVLVNKGYFGQYFPEYCLDGHGCIGTDEKAFKSALQAEIPNLDWPLVTEQGDENTTYSWRNENKPFVPNYLDVMDLLQFCFKHIALPIEGSFHSFYSHHHINGFDETAGRNEFLKKIETIFSRNGLAYEMKPTGEIVRLLSPALVRMISETHAPSEIELRSLLARANKKILHYDVSFRYDAVKELWDFWERIKSYQIPTNKSASVKKLLDLASNNLEFRAELETEAKALTNIGNAFFIRHAEMKQIKIQDSDHIEYLYQRMFSLIHLLLKKLPR